MDGVAVVLVVDGVGAVRFESDVKGGDVSLLVEEGEEVLDRIRVQRGG